MYYQFHHTRLLIFLLCTVLTPDYLIKEFLWAHRATIPDLANYEFAVLPIKLQAHKNPFANLFYFLFFDYTQIFCKLRPLSYRRNTFIIINIIIVVKLNMQTMHETIQIEKDSENYSVFYSTVKLDQLCPTQTLTRTIELGNQYIDNFRSNSIIPDFAYNELARLIWLNWMYDHFKTNTIVKPILIHQHNNNFIVDCGDTRIMAMSLHNNFIDLPVLLTIKNNFAQQFGKWLKIESNNQLFSLLDLDHLQSNLIIQKTKADDTHAWCWYDISTEINGQHWRNEPLRLKTLKNYLNTCEKHFEFTENWIRSSIHWPSYY